MGGVKLAEGNLHDLKLMKSDRIEEIISVKEREEQVSILSFKTLMSKQYTIFKVRSTKLRASLKVDRMGESRA